MKVVVGLGNPGSRYAGTRHNVGFDVVDTLARSPHVSPFRDKFDALVAEYRLDGEVLLLVKPQTFMNLSGRAVRAVLDFYKLSPQHLLVVCDDINLPLGKLRLRPRGSPGGHNGLRDIQQHLGTEDYPRLRIGVGAPRPGEAVDYVLGRFTASEQPVIAAALSRAALAVECWAVQGLEAAMNRFNAPDKPTHSSANKAPRPALPPTGPSDIQTAPPLADTRTLAGATPLAPIVVEEGTDTPASAVQAPSATATSPVPPPGQEESTSPPDHSGSS